MNGNLPPKLPEAPPADFEGRFVWMDHKVTQLLEQSAVEGKSPLQRDVDEAVMRAAVFSESLGKIVDIDDAESPLPDRARAVQTLPCTREGDSYNKRPPSLTSGYLINWELSPEGVVHSSFRNYDRTTREQALDNLIEVLNAPDLEVVNFEQAMKWTHPPRD
ncbi:MAG: hypothetical protein JWL89_178 [Candidatus Saccharibacteria bacterium]|nr:hypothetical protein [Candidatus Saccharibacteria bacterium]